MRLLLVFLLLLDVPPAIDFLWRLLPLVLLFVGLRLGIWLGYEGMEYQFNQHIDGHLLSVAPISGCRFCKTERGLA